MSQLPALQIVVPLLAAPLCVLLRHRLLVRWFATAAVAVSFCISLALLSAVEDGNVLSYHIGGWRPPIGIELRVDALSAYLLLLVSGVATVVAFVGIGVNSHNVRAGREAMFYALYLLCVTGLLGMTITGDAFNVFVFLEISSLSSYALIAMGRSRRALSSALSYLFVGTVGATFYLVGVGMLYQLTGTLNMADLASRLSDAKESRTLVVGFVMIFTGLAVKLAVFPLHQWLPNAYAFAPSSVSAFLSGTATKVVYYLVLRFVFVVFGAAFVFDTMRLQALLMPLSLLAMFVGSAAAIYQSDFKRLLAYSSVAQLGYMTLGLSLGTEQGLRAGLLHLMNHGLMKSGLFLVAAAVVAKIGSSKLDDFAGLGRRMPLTMAALVVGGLALIGVPGTSGFISKWFLVVAAIDAGQMWLAFAILLSSLLALAYVWRVIEIAYFKPAREGMLAVDDPASVTIPAWVLLGATIFFGLYADWPLALATEAMTAAMRPNP